MTRAAGWGRWHEGRRSDEPISSRKADGHGLAPLFGPAGISRLMSRATHQPGGKVKHGPK
jgi:hypothetical protein